MLVKKEMNIPINYKKYLEGLENASLFDLWRIKCAINRMVEDPSRQIGIKRNLSPGMELSYFDPDSNKLVDSVIVEVKRSRALVMNKQDGKRWNIPFYMLNLEGVDTTIQPRTSSAKLDRTTLSVGDQVGYHSKFGNDVYGTILKLNPKRARVKLTNGEIWNVSYPLLFSVMDGAHQEKNAGGLLIEGIAVVADD